jgi:hypothetical protein
MTNTPIAAKLAEASRAYLDRAKMVIRGVAESIELVGLENELREALRAYDDAKGSEGEFHEWSNRSALSAVCEKCECLSVEAAANASCKSSHPVAQAVPVAWYIECKNQSGLEYTSVTFDRRSVTPYHKPLYNYPPTAAPEDK